MIAPQETVMTVMLGIDPVEQVLQVRDIKIDGDSIVDATDPPGTPYVREFKFEAGMAEKLHKWFVACGMTKSDAEGSVRAFGHTMDETLNDLVDASDGVSTDNADCVD